MTQAETVHTGKTEEKQVSKQPINARNAASKDNKNLYKKSAAVKPSSGKSKKYEGPVELLFTPS